MNRIEDSVEGRAEQHDDVGAIGPAAAPRRTRQPPPNFFTFLRLFQSDIPSHLPSLTIVNLYSQNYIYHTSESARIPDSIMRSVLSALNRTAATAWAQPPTTAAMRGPRAAFKFDSICARCRRQQVRSYQNMADDPRWLSVVDNPARIVRTGRKHGPGLIILGMVD